MTDQDGKHFMLCEGDFASWRGKVFHRVQKEGKGLENYLTENSRFKQANFRERSTEAAAIIIGHVPARLLNRVSIEDLLDAPRLLTSLGARARPFNFFGLPPEQRNTIYDLLPDLQASELAVYDCTFPCTRKTPRQALPAITRASRQLRQETRVKFIRNTTFKLNVPHWPLSPVRELEIHDPCRWVPFCNFDAAEPIIRTWTTDVIGNDAKHLREVCVEARWPGGPCWVRGPGFRLQYDKDDGLTLTAHELSESPFKAILEDQVASITPERASRLKGESIVVLLLCTPKKWQEKALWHSPKGVEMRGECLMPLTAGFRLIHPEWNAS